MADGQPNSASAPVPLPGAAATPAAAAGHPSRVGGVRFLDWLDGRKTYLLTVLGALYVFGSTLGWWPCDDRVLAVLGFGGLAALRNSVPSPKP